MWEGQAQAYAGWGGGWWWNGSLSFFENETWPITGLTGARSLVAGLGALGLPIIGHPSLFLISLSFSASVAFSVAT